MLLWAQRNIRPLNFAAVAIAGLLVGACTTSDVRTNSDGSTTVTSVPIAQVGGAGSQGGNEVVAQPVNSGLLLVSVANPNLCVGVDTVAAGGNLIVRACDGNQATLWQLAGGQLRMGTTLCAQAANASAAATTLDIGSTWVLATCDSTNLTQHIDTQIEGGVGPTLAPTTRFDLVTQAAPVVGQPIMTAQHNTLANVNVTLILAGTVNAQAGSGNDFAIRLANSSGACLGTTGTQPEIVACTSTSNQWRTTPNGRMTTGANLCLAIDTISGKMTLPTCAATDGNQAVNTFGSSLMAGALVTRCAQFQNVALGANQVTWVECGYGAQPFSLGPVN